jgi:hypothetical protein
MNLRTVLEKALAVMMKNSLPCVGTFPRKERRENIWAQIAVSSCVLLLPPILAIAVLAPHPPRAESGDTPGASEFVGEFPSTSLPLTEGSLLPPSRPRKLPGTQPNQFEDRFASAFAHTEEISGQLPSIPEALSILPPLRKTVVADELASKVEKLTRKIEEVERERERNAIEVVSTKRALSAKELELVRSATEQRIEIDTRRMEIAALKTQIELYKSQVNQLHDEIASKTNKLENHAGRIADLGDSPRRPAPATQKENRKARIDGRRVLGAIASITDRRQDHREKQDPEQRPAHRDLHKNRHH